MLTLLLSMHLLAAPLQLTPEAHDARPELISAGQRHLFLEAALGTAALALPLAGVPWAGRMIFTAVNGCCSGGSPGFFGQQLNYIAAGVLFEAVLVPPLAALTLRLASTLTGSESHFVNAFAGAFVGNVLGLPAGLLVAGMGVHLAGNDHPMTLLVAVAAGALVQAGFVAGGAALGSHWGEGAEAAPVAPPTWVAPPASPLAARLTFPIFATRF